MELHNKPVLVLGLARSGVAAARLLAARGARVIGVDNADNDALQAVAKSLRAKGVEVRLGVAGLGRVSADLAVLSPGFPPENALLREVQSAGVPVISELELGFRFCSGPIVAVTGTNGKTTTTELCAAVLRAGGLRAAAAGNIGRAFCDLWVATDSEQLDGVVLEVSSFQLERIEQFRPRVSVMLNVAPDHLDRYASLSDYAAAKERIFLNQGPTEWAVINADCRERFASLKRPNAPRQVVFSARGRCPNCELWFDGVKIHSAQDGELLDMTSTRLRGPHNAENIMASLAVGAAFNVPLGTAREAIRAYQPLPHRCEFVAEIDGVRFINDSKATNLDAVEKALAGFDRPVVLIAGGRDKGFDFTALNGTLRRKVKFAVLIGETRDKLAASWSSAVQCAQAGSLDEAVRCARQHAQPGEVVLLSPACSSFDMFKNYEDRGEQFKQIVRTLASGQQISRAHDNQNQEPVAVSGSED
ncbi:MAG: UDP-N-acetylmuramoyl-L-alanine--D-glutamate ligase [Verrucomicrobia bacterium]|nr:UDP-N-acetylmuramoyl-L-alanine--D-glutamate ligase [Verrucomicrobiota bacterium]